MTCEEMRIQLAAYRRSEWTPEEQRAVNLHLTECSACRRWETEARGVGEQLRQLPTITPAAAFRSRVFAAIQAEQVAIERGVAPPVAPEDLPVRPAKPAPVLAPIPLVGRAGQAIPIVERIGEVGLGRMRGQRVFFGKTTAIATIAALFLVVFTANFLSIFNVSTPNIGTKVIISCVSCISNPDHYDLDARYPLITSVLADSGQVVYAAQNASGQEMLLVKNRGNETLTPLLLAPSEGPITLQGLSSKLLVYLTGTAQTSWSLVAMTANADGLLQPMTDGNALMVAIHGQALDNSTIVSVQNVWVDGTTILAAFNLADGTTLVQQVAFNGPLATRTTVLRSKPGHVISDLYLDGATLYWVDVFTGPDGVPHSLLSRQNLTTGAAPISFDIESYRPVGSQQHMAWFESETTLYVNNGSGTPTLKQVGAIVTETADGTLKKISGDNVLLSNVWRGAGYLTWQDEKGVHLYRVADGGTTTQDINVPAGAVTLGFSAEAVAWATLPTADLATSRVYVVSEG